jgi:Tfp pilus assembly PilM family ATPase
MNHLLGVEIGKETVKCLVAEFKGVNPVPTRYVAKVIEQDDDLAAAAVIAQVMRDCHVKPRTVTVAVPRNLVTVRNLHIPSKDPEEMRRMIDLHIGRIVPYKREDVLYVAAEAGRDSAGYARVILAIAYAEIIKRQLKVFDRAGIIVDRLVLSSQGVYRYVTNTYKNQIKTGLFVIIDIDRDHADFIVADKAQMYFTRSIAQKAASLDEAEGRTRLVGQVRQSLVIFNNEEINERPAAVYVCGHAAALIAQDIIKELEIPSFAVEEPLDGVLSNEQRDAPPVVSSAALARLTLDGSAQQCEFIIPEVQEQKVIKENLRELIALGITIIYVLAVLSLLSLMRLATAQNYASLLRKETAALERDVGELGKELPRIAFVQQRLAVRAAGGRVLRRLQMLVPSDITLTYCAYDAQSNVTIRGLAKTSSGVLTFAGVLNGERYFSSAAVKYTRKRKVKDVDLVDFEITFSYGQGGAR